MADSPYLRARILSTNDDELRSICLNSDGTHNAGFSERSRVEIAPPAGPGWTFLVDDEPLDTGASGYWQWRPGFYAGVVAAELQYHGQTVAKYVLDVSPDPAKLGAETYHRLIEELRRADPTLIIGEEPASTSTGVLGTQQDPWVEFRRLRMYGPSFVAALKEVVRQPLRSHRATRKVVPIRNARRVDARTVIAAATNGTIGALADRVDATSARNVHGEPLYDIPWHEEHLDGPANRCMMALLLTVAGRARHLKNRLSEQVQRAEASETRSDVTKRWPNRRRVLDSLTRDLDNLSRHEPFRSVTRPEITAAGLNTVAADPAYTRAYRTGWRAIRAGLLGTEPDEAVWLRPTWELYERWCFLQIVKLTQERATGTFTRNFHGATRTWQGTTDAGTEITVLFQPRFRAFDNMPDSGLHSTSREREPDIVVVTRTDNKCRFLAFDAKYCHSRSSILESMASAHIYHDSLRIGSESPDSAILLIPAGGGASWLENDEFIDKNGVGVLRLAPNIPPNQIADFLASRLRIPPPQAS